MDFQVDIDNYIELATQGKASEFKTQLSGDLNQSLNNVKDIIDTEVHANIMNGGEVNNFAKVVGIVEEEPSGEKDPEDTIENSETISFF